MMIEVCKIYNIGPVYMGDLFNKVDHLYHSRNVKSLQQPRFNSVTYERNSFNYQEAKGWNVLPWIILSKMLLHLQVILKCYSRHGTVNSAIVVTVMSVF